MTSSLDEPTPEEIRELAEALKDWTFAHFPWEALLAHMEENTRE